LEHADAVRQIEGSTIQTGALVQVLSRDHHDQQPGA
jgi:hypothetical protein